MGRNPPQTALLSVGDRVTRRPFGEHGYLRGTIREVTEERGYLVDWDAIVTGDGWGDDDVSWCGILAPQPEIVVQPRQFHEDMLRDDPELVHANLEAAIATERSRQKMRGTP